MPKNCSPRFDLAELIAAQGMTIEQVAARADLPESLIQIFLNGKGSPRRTSMGAIAVAIGVDYPKARSAYEVSRTRRETASAQAAAKRQAERARTVAPPQITMTSTRRLWRPTSQENWNVILGDFPATMDPQIVWRNSRTVPSYPGDLPQDELLVRDILGFECDHVGGGEPRRFDSRSPITITPIPGANGTVSHIAFALGGVEQVSGLVVISRLALVGIDLMTMRPLAPAEMPPFISLAGRLHGDQVVDVESGMPPSGSWHAYPVRSIAARDLVDDQPGGHERPDSEWEWIARHLGKKYCPYQAIAITPIYGACNTASHMAISLRGETVTVGHAVIGRDGTRGLDLSVMRPLYAKQRALFQSIMGWIAPRRLMDVENGLMTS